MFQRLLFFTFVFSFVFFAVGSVRAEDADYRDCEQDKDLSLRIRGCKRFMDRAVLARGDRGNAMKMLGAFAVLKLVDAYHNRAIIYFNKGDYDRTIADFDQLISIEKRYDAYIGRGDAYSAKGDYDHAIKDYDQAIGLEPKYTTAYLHRGFVYSRKRDYDRAIIDCNEAIRLDPKNAKTYVSRGVIHREKGDYEHALADFSDAIRLDPNLALAYSHRGLTYGMKGEAYRNKVDYDRAIVDLSEAIHRDPRDPIARSNRGTAYEKNNDPTRAREDFQAALALDPESQAAKDGLARLAAATPVVAAPPPVASPPASSPAPQQSSTSHSCAGSRRVALVVGNSAYPGAALLANPANDAEDVADLLQQKLCFRVILAKDATLAAFSQKIGEFAEAAEGAEVALFYYAGHGMQFQQTNYLLPIDSRLANEYEAMHNNVSAQDVVTMLESRAKFTLVLLDACRNNPIEEDFRRRMSIASRDYGAARGLAPMTTRGGETLVVFATRPNERAADGSGRNSPFTRAFLEHIATPGKDVELVLRDVTARVRELTAGRQAPQRLTELQHGLILLPAR